MLFCKESIGTNLNALAKTKYLPKVIALAKAKAMARPLKGQLSKWEAERLPLRKYQTVKRWVRQKTPGTLKHMLRNMDRLMKETGQDPDQFLEYARKTDPVEVSDLLESLTEKLKLTSAARIVFIADIRSFLHHNGFNNLPKTNLVYILQDWHRAYKKEEIRNLLSYLDSPFHKLYVYMAAESGLRAQKVIDVKYGHIKEDLEAGLEQVAIRFPPEEYQKRKSAGFTFLGRGSLKLIRELIEKGKIGTDAKSPIIPVSYMASYLALKIAQKKAGLDGKLQPVHSLRKYFEKALDDSDIDHEKKMVLEGHFAGTRAKHYSDREWENLRETYAKAYPHIDIDAGDPELEKRVQDWQSEKKDLLRQIKELKEAQQQKDEVIPDVLKQLEALRKEMEQLKKSAK